jgi:hypothetical protein
LDGKTGDALLPEPVSKNAYTCTSDDAILEIGVFKTTVALRSANQFIGKITYKHYLYSEQ